MELLPPSREALRLLFLARLPLMPLIDPRLFDGSSSQVSSNFPSASSCREMTIMTALAFKLLLLPLLLWVNWVLVAPYLNAGVGNPFSIFIISGHIPTSSPSDPLYRKTWWDLPFIAYYIVVFSFIRESLSTKVSRPLARYFGIRNENKIDRFAEQMYALVYFTVFGAWGYVRAFSHVVTYLTHFFCLQRVMTQLPSYWYNTSAFWDGQCFPENTIDYSDSDVAYPSWAIKPELKAYYLIQFAYWWQQLLVLVLGLEKPRKDYLELVAHHFVTLWLIGCVLPTYCRL